MLLLSLLNDSLNSNAVELHYYFEDESHSMDAFVQNKCEYEFLGILKEVIKALNVEVIIETEPLENGGLRRWFKVVAKQEKKTAVIKTAVITSLLIGVFINPLSNTLSKVGEHLIDKVFEDKESKELSIENQEIQNEKLRAEITKDKVETKLLQEKLNQSSIIKKKRSNFYETLQKYPKLKQVSIIQQNDQRQNLSEEFIVQKNEFKKFILVSDELDSIIIDEAIIEIISPVLKKGAYKWIGIYNGETYYFTMKSNEFKTLVQVGEVEFKNGFTINCQLELEKKIDNEGVEKITNYKILRVNHYFQNSEPIETKEGKHHRQSQEAIKQQTKLNF